MLQALTFVFVFIVILQLNRSTAFPPRNPFARDDYVPQSALPDLMLVLTFIAFSLFVWLTIVLGQSPYQMRKGLRLWSRMSGKWLSLCGIRLRTLRPAVLG